MQYKIRNLTKKIILLPDIDGMPPLEPREERDLLEFANIEKIQKSRILAQLIKQKYIEKEEELEENEEEIEETEEPSDDDMDDVLQNIKNIKKNALVDEQDEVNEISSEESQKYDGQIFDENGKIIIDLMPEELTGTIDAIKEVCKSTSKKVKDVSSKHDASCKEFSKMIQDIKENNTISSNEEIPCVQNKMNFAFENIGMSKLKEICHFLDVIKKNTDLNVKNIRIKFELE